MYTATADTRQTAAAAAAAATAGGQETPVDGELFTRELLARIQATTPTQDKIARAMEKLAGALPGMTVTNLPLSAFGEAGGYFIRTGADVTANLSPEVMATMADDEEVFTKVKEMIEGLMKAGKSQNLVDSGGASSVQRNVVVSAEDIRYVEVQRDGEGTTLSVSSLLFDAWNEVNEALEAIIAQHQGAQRNGSFVGSSSNTFMGALSNQNFSANGGFSGITGFSASWRFESFISSGSSAMQALRAQQTQMQRVDVLIQQWEAGGGGSGLDFFALMQMNGLADPIVLDLGDEGFNLSSAEDGVYFDIKGDGSQVRTGFITGNNAFLYLDGNGNGVVDDANELFGDHGGFANGFAKLAQYDDNGDGVIDARDAAYDDLKVWRDLNGDGVNQEGESMSLAEAGVASMSLSHDDSRSYDAYGNVIGERSTFTRTDGSRGAMADVWLRYLQ